MRFSTLFFDLDDTLYPSENGLWQAIKERIKGTGFSSVTDFIVFVIRDIVASGSIQKESTLTKTEIDQIRQRLKSLGYIE